MGTTTVQAIIVGDLPARVTMNGRTNLVKRLQARNIKLADPLADDRISNLGLLIGADYYFKLLGVPELEDGVFGIPSKVGMLVGGTVNNSDNISCNQVTVLRIEVSNNTLNDQLEKLWEMNSVNFNQCEDGVMENFKQSINYCDSKYSVSLPWKLNHPPLPSNFYYAKARLNSILLNLRKNPVDLEFYNEIINNQLSSGFIEEVTDLNSSDKVHYLAHRHVKKDSLTTPLRIVYDCSAKINGHPSLNDCLYAGPNLINDLISILIRFRFDRYVGVSDIRKAFLNVGLNEADRDSTRFLWPENPFDVCSPLKTYRFSSVLFGSTASPFLLNATLKYHLDNISSPLAMELKRNVYIDNLFITSNNEIDLSNKKVAVKSLLESANFSLHEWQSNSAFVSDSLDPSEKCKVLGINWYTGRNFSRRLFCRRQNDETFRRK